MASSDGFQPTESSGETNSPTRQAADTAWKRRRFLATTGAASAFALTGCLGGSGGGGSQTLTVSSWTGTHGEVFKNKIAPAFKEETGAEMEVVPTWSEKLSKIKAAPEDSPPYDVTVAEESVLYPGIAEDFWLPIRYENVPNFEKNTYSYVQSSEFPLPTDLCAPVAIGPYAIMYRDPEQAGSLNFEPTSYPDLHKNAGAVNLGMEGGHFMYPTGCGALAHNTDNGLQELYDKSTHSAVWDSLEQMKIDAWFSGAGQFVEPYRNEIIDVGILYTSAGIPKLDTIDDIRMSVPDVNFGYTDTYTVVRGTDNRELAEKFINFLLSDKGSQLMTDNYPNPSLNKNVTYSETQKKYFATTNEGISNFNPIQFEYFVDNPKVADEFSQKLKQLKSQA